MKMNRITRVLSLYSGVFLAVSAITIAKLNSMEKEQVLESKTYIMENTTSAKYAKLEQNLVGKPLSCWKSVADGLRSKAAADAYTACKSGLKYLK